MSRLTKEQTELVLKFFKETGFIRQTAKKAGVSRKAVRRVLRQGPNFNAPASHPRPSKLDPYKAKIGVLVREQNLSAVRVMEEIQELGYDGRYTILKDYIRSVRPTPYRKPRPPIDHPPGEEGQMDWSPHQVIMGGRRTVVQTGSIVLCFSRWLYHHHFTDQTLESVIKLHEMAFQELGAVPVTMTYDNMTTVGRHTGPSEIWINPQFKAFADQYDFRIVILPPGAKERHGKVERPFTISRTTSLQAESFKTWKTSIEGETSGGTILLMSASTGPSGSVPWIDLKGRGLISNPCPTRSPVLSLKRSIGSFTSILRRH